MTRLYYKIRRTSICLAHNELLQHDIVKHNQLRTTNVAV